MRYRLFPGVMGVLIVVASSVALAWGVWPVGRFSRQALLNLPTGESKENAYKIELIWPARLRLGDAGVIHMVLESGNKDWVAESGDNHLVESRLEAANFVAFPAGSILEPLLPGRQVVYYWRVLPEQTGDHEVVIWVSISPQPGDSGVSNAQLTDQSQLLTAQKVPIRVGGLLGLNGLQARWLGSIGIVIGIGFCLHGLFAIQNEYWKETVSDHA